jgi:hypothetical protein
LIDAAARSTRQWLTSEGLRADDFKRDRDRTGVPTGPRVAGATTAQHAQCGANLPSCSI